MPATLAKAVRKTRSRFSVKQTTPAGIINTGHLHQPQAGNGACRKCSCKQFVPESRFMLPQVEGNQFIACANCGHDVKQHA
jgi:hypothetical protein